MLWIGGFQKFSLLDYPKKMAAILFTQGCNFRCPYCHNPSLVDPNRYQDTISEDEVLDFLYTRRGKLSALSITGGEPTIQEDLESFVGKVKKLGYLIKIDTNGSQPTVIKRLIDKGIVDYWAMDIKAPMHLYKLLTRSDIDSDLILESMELIRNSGVEYEFRTTLFEALFNWNDISAIRSILKPKDKFYLQQCRYADTLEEVLNTDQMRIKLSENTYLLLREHPACQNLIEWGKCNDIQIAVRSI